MATITSALKIEMISEVPDESLSAAVDTQKDAFSVVSMFSGCGGMDLGFRGSFSYNGIEHERLNFDIVAAYDNNPKCVETYNLNIVDHAQVLDLGSYDPKDLPAADVVIGGFPCQDFATCGPRRGLQSERGQLYRALIN